MASTKHKNDGTAADVLNETQSATRPQEKKSKAGSNGARSGAVERAAAALASGDLTASLPDGAEKIGASERRALRELEAMARNMRRTVSRLHRAADAIEAVAGRVLEGGRTLALSVSDEASSVDATVSSIAEISASARAVAEAVSALSHLAQTTSTSSLEMAASIDEVSANADALTAFVEETASSIEEMAASVLTVAASTESLAQATDETERSMRAIDESTQRVGISAGETAVLADEVKLSAEQGARIVRETAESMRATRRGIETAAETISALGERSERIGDITRVINEIADRTNLLSLNARILAAQAGPQGRGFAVVAEEIKELSERTARSTDEIAELIKGVRDSVGESIAQVSSNRQLADEATGLAERAAVSLDEISNKTGLSASAIRQIAEAAATQSLESHQVTELMAEVRRRAQEIERATSEQAQTSKQIGERAVRMAELTEQVRRAMQEQAGVSKHIASAMEQLTGVIEQIGNAVGEQYRGAEEVMRAIEIIREAVTRNQASIVQINYTTGQLEYEASSLRDSVSLFRLPSPERGGHLSCGVPAGIPTLDVLESSTLSSHDLLSMICECLVGAGEGAEVEPALATSWDVSADGRTYTFHLRRGARFHNGRMVSAGDVVYSIRRTLRQSKSGAWVFKSLLGAEAFARGETEELPGARARDEQTVELELSEPLAFFLPTLCLRFAAVVPREEIEQDGGARFMQKPVGTGPFRLVSYEREAGRVELARFDDYWNGDEPYVDGVTIEYDENGERLFERLRRGELSFLREGSPERIARLASDPEWRSCIVSATQLHTQCLVLDALQQPFNDVRMRRAIAHAIDKERLVREAYAGMAIPASGPIPPGLMGYDPDYRGLEYDPDRARRLLAEAGYRRGLSLKLWRSFPEQSASELGGQLMCEMLSEIGIKCEVYVTDTADLMAAAHDGRAPLAELSWYADYADPDNFTYVLFNSANSEGGIGRTAHVAEIDQSSARARTMVNRAERAAAYSELQRLIAEEALCAFLTHRSAAVIHRPDVEGLHVHLVSPIVRPQEMWLSKK
jgi:ABC-type transport system substrate-binding protein/methyl-accepting chemotaxis protein